MLKNQYMKWSMQSLMLLGLSISFVACGPSFEVTKIQKSNKAGVTQPGQTTDASGKLFSVDVDQISKNTSAEAIGEITMSYSIVNFEIRQGTQKVSFETVHNDNSEFKGSTVTQGDVVYDLNATCKDGNCSELAVVVTVYNSKTKEKISFASVYQMISSTNSYLSNSDRSGKYTSSKKALEDLSSSDVMGI